MSALCPPAPEPPSISVLDLSLDSARTIVRSLWLAAFGSKAADRDFHLLRVSVGLRRLTRFQDSLHQATGVRVATGVLMQLGSADMVAHALASGALPASSPLLLLREGSTDSSLFIVSAASGLVLELCDLATALDFPGTLWGLQSPGIDGDCVPLTSVDAIARHHVAAIERRGVQGTISLLGYSFGGLVVIEMARLLRAAGRSVELVGLLDSNCFQRYWPRGAWLLFALRKTVRRLRELRGMTAAVAWRHLAAQAHALQQMRERRRRERAGSAAEAPTAVDDLTAQRSMYYIAGLPHDFQKVRDASIYAFEHYEPKRIEGSVVLFKAQLGDPHACDPQPVWRRVASRLEVVVVPGSHTTMVRKPYVLRLAEEVASALTRSRKAAHFN